MDGITFNSIEQFFGEKPNEVESVIEKLAARQKTTSGQVVQNLESDRSEEDGDR